MNWSQLIMKPIVLMELQPKLRWIPEMAESSHAENVTGTIAEPWAQRLVAFR